jgi:hypothetical protein
MAERTTRGTIAAGVAAWLVLLAIGSWRAQHEEAAQHRAHVEAACLEEIARHSEVLGEGYSLRAASGATGDLPAFYEQQWVPLIGVLVPRSAREMREATPRDADARARALEACVSR